MKDISLESFISDFKARGAAERYLQLAIETVIDMGNGIISSLQLGRPERYREIPHTLLRLRSSPARLQSVSLRW